MDLEVILFWFVLIACLSGLVAVGRRARSAGWGWLIVFLMILLVDLGGWFGERALIYIAFGLWILLVVVPGLISRTYFQRILQQRYTEASRLARVISWLHPADGWREQPRLIRAVGLAQRGELTEALATLKRFQHLKSAVGMIAVANLYRITQQWEEFRQWESRNPVNLESFPQLLPTLLRARGETNDLDGLCELYARHAHQIRKMAPAASRDLCRLVLFAFGGKREWVERLFAGSLAALPEPTRQFWLATTDLAAGKVVAAKAQLETLLASADPPMRLAIERRLTQVGHGPPPQDPELGQLVEDVGQEHDHEERFGARPSIFSAHARATILLIILNLVMFGAEVYEGGATNLETLHQLGGLFPPAVRAGQWWRLFAPLFLHFGLAHLAMNLFALWVLGPFVELALGARRFLFVYLISGVGSMALVMALASGQHGQQLTVGASGCIMCLVGATGALMLRGWLREKASSAKRRLIVVVMILLMQSLFDLVVPQVSMTAHLSGAFIGFAVTLFLPDRLKQTGSSK